MLKRMEKLFWSLYARVYDAIGLLSPYQELLDEVVERAEIRPGLSILNLGCGTGNLERKLKGSDCTVLGVDLSEQMLRRARSKVCSEDVCFQQADLNRELPPGMFDRILSVNVLYALDDPPEVLKKAGGQLRPDGLMVHATPRRGGNPLKIAPLHLKHAWSRGPRVGIPASGRFMVAAPALLVVGVLNLLILGRGRKGSYHFPEEEELRSWFGDGWQIIKVGRTYGDQNLIITAKRGD